MGEAGFGEVDVAVFEALAREPAGGGSVVSQRREADARQLRYTHSAASSLVARSLLSGE
jgi:hypothetical protein